ncbi:hypothetical protein SDC9_192421 [bioreactor metagenome]|uniref:Uncharacterized protein n=1 Tax=bioreactor metagenome TaxID=1076179 RepID=A0A645I963_9ZZZZ
MSSSGTSDQNFSQKIRLFRRVSSRLSDAPSVDNTYPSPCRVQQTVREPSAGLGQVIFQPYGGGPASWKKSSGGWNPNLESHTFDLRNSHEGRACTSRMLRPGSSMKTTWLRREILIFSSAPSDRETVASPVS